MVGCYFPIEEWKDAVIDFGAAIASTSIKLFSFELKRELNFSNLRESFFQAVSNSSWANEGYLVAAEIDATDDFLDELKRLSTSFGIGVIKLDRTDPDSSELLFPALIYPAISVIFSGVKVVVFVVIIPHIESVGE